MRTLRVLAMFAMAAPLHAFVPPSARATPHKSIASVEQRPTSSGDHIVSRRSLVADAAVGLAALGLLGQPGASSAYEPPRGPAAFEARKAFYEAEREKRVLSTPTVMRMWKKLIARWFRPASVARLADWSNLAARGLVRPDQRLCPRRGIVLKALQCGVRLLVHWALAWAIIRPCLLTS